MQVLRDTVKILYRMDVLNEKLDLMKISSTLGNAASLLQKFRELVFDEELKSEITDVILQLRQKHKTECASFPLTGLTGKNIAEAYESNPNTADISYGETMSKVRRLSAPSTSGIESEIDKLYVKFSKTQRRNLELKKQLRTALKVRKHTPVLPTHRPVKPVLVYKQLKTSADSVSMAIIKDFVKSLSEPADTKEEERSLSLLKSNAARIQENRAPRLLIEQPDGSMLEESNNSYRRRTLKGKSKKLRCETAIQAVLSYAKNTDRDNGITDLSNTQ